MCEGVPTKNRKSYWLAPVLGLRRAARGGRGISIGQVPVARLDLITGQVLGQDAFSFGIGERADFGRSVG